MKERYIFLLSLFDFYSFILFIISSWISSRKTVRWEPLLKTVAERCTSLRASNCLLNQKNINQNVSDTLKVLEIFQSEDVLVYI